VPPTWQLLRQSGAGMAEVVARGVCSFDLVPDGVVYSTGGAVYHATRNGGRRQLCTGSRIAQVIALP